MATENQPSLLENARLGVIWSIVQNWGSKFFTFALSIVLARLLSPTDFGVASAVSVIILLVPLVAEMGFGDAIMQRRNLGPNDLNLPFMMSVAIVILMFAAIVFYSDRVSTWLDIDDSSVYVIVASGVILLTTPSMFQEAAYKRNMRFKSLALRSFLANIVGGTLAVICAWAGFGIWSFVVQAYASGIISVVWLWRRPQWVPGLELEPKAFRELTRFGVPVVAQRLVDFAGTKIIDVIIVSQLGLAAYGLYAIGSRIYQTMMQLLQGALYDVSLTVLSTVAADRERIAKIYLKTTNLAATFISPIFVLTAALAPEISDVLLGDRWAGVEEVMAPLLLLGALQSVQFINAPFFAARGKPELILPGGIVKSVTTVAVLLLVPSDSTSQLVVYFALCQLSSTPITYYLLTRNLGLTLLDALRSVLSAAVSCFCAYWAVLLVRAQVSLTGIPFFDGVLLGIVFSLAFGLCLFVLDRQKFFDAYGLLKVRVVGLRNRIARKASP